MSSRYTLKLGDNSEQALSNLAEESDATKADVVRDAIALYDVIRNEVSEGNHRVCIVDENDEVVKEIVLPGLRRPVGA